MQSVADATGMSISMLSRLENGLKHPTLPSVLQLTRLYAVGLEDIVPTWRAPDPRIKGRPLIKDGNVIIPLSRTSADLRAYRHTIQPGLIDIPRPRAHAGSEWLYVLSGRLRLILGIHDLVMVPGEAAEFDSRAPHWFGNASGTRPMEFLGMFGPHGRRVHLSADRAKARREGVPESSTTRGSSGTRA